MSLRSEVIRVFNELMAGSKKITELPAAASLTGDELVEIVKDGTNQKTTTQDIADLGGGGGGGVQSIVAGANITVDDTDPQNPIVSSSGGGGSQDLQSVLDQGATATITDVNVDIISQGATDYGAFSVQQNSVYIAQSNNTNTAAVSIEASQDGIKVIDTRTSRGIQGVDNYSANIQANDYTQKVYVDTKAPLASPTFTGTPAAPTAAPGTNTTQVATTAFVQATLSNVGNILYMYNNFV